MLKLKEVLTRLKVTQSALAEALGLGKSTVSHLCNGQWPKSTDEKRLKKRIREFLIERGATKTEIATAFNESDMPRANATRPQHTIHNEEETMLLRRQGLFQSAKKHFGLFRDPFSDDVQTHEDVFVSPDIRYVREAMFHTAKHGGFVAVVGESGAGKSTLRRDLIDRIQREGQHVIVIEPYVLGLEDNDVKGKTLKATHLAEAIMAAVAPLEKIKRSPETRFSQVHRALRDSRRAGANHVLIIEEAHGLPIPTIKHLKRFFELEDGFKKLLSIILIGQPELKLKLSETNHEVREVVQRCELVELMPLDDRLEEYLGWKFDRAGKRIAEVVDGSGVEALREKLTVSTNRRDRRDTVSLLYPLAVGNLLTASMNLAAEIGAPRVTADVVRSV